ncbi:MAG: helix-turn-helix domain-containing protein [Candidatus Pacearchaeota archaeon]|jgi:sugar-specific transcriptional regulator TrmB
MIEQTLKLIGLTDGETKVYLALLELGTSTTWNITKKSKVSGSKVYEVLERLKEKGLVSFITKNNIKYFEASSPEKIISYLKEKQTQIEFEKLEIQKIIPELILKQKGVAKSEAKIFIGFEGLKTANEDIIHSLKKGEEWLSMGLTEQPEQWENYFNKKQEERAKKGIIHKHLLNEKYKSLYHQRKKLAHTEFRFLSKDFEMPTSIEIYSNKVIIMLIVPESPMAIMIESKEVAESFRKYFYALWEMTKRD